MGGPWLISGGSGWTGCPPIPVRLVAASRPLVALSDRRGCPPIPVRLVAPPRPLAALSDRRADFALPPHTLVVACVLILRRLVHAGAVEIDRELARAEVALARTRTSAVVVVLVPTTLVLTRLELNVARGGASLRCRKPSAEDRRAVAAKRTDENARLHRWGVLIAAWRAEQPSSSREGQCAGAAAAPPSTHRSSRRAAGGGESSQAGR